MLFKNLQEFTTYLEQNGKLRRVRAEVDPLLEAPEIAQRILREGGPALLFENPRGASFPLLMNLFGTMDRVVTAIGQDPAEIGRELLTTIQRVNPPSLKGLWQSRDTLSKAALMHPRRASSGSCQQVVEAPDLGQLPVVQCWPEDAGRFITYGMVITHHPETKHRNFALYRLQVYDRDKTGMHWQSMKGGRGHYWAAEQLGQSLEVAVVIGCSPILMLASILPLPENMDEISFAGFLEGRGIKMVQAKSIDMRVPAEAEFVLEGIVRPEERQREGPFGDHFGHYSDAADFPVFRIQKLTRRRHPLYVATVVGKPPQEDKFIGIAAGQMVGPLIRVINPNIVDMCAYVGAGFHNLLVVSVQERHPKEVLKTAMSLLGTGQLSLTKVMVLVRPQQNPSLFYQVLHEIGLRCSIEDNLLLLPVAPLDTLDFTSFKMHVGSKLVIDATGEVVHSKESRLRESPERFDPLIQRWKFLDGGFLVVVVEQDPRAVLERLIQASIGARFIIAVSPDVDLEDEENLQWGIFTRFDPVRDMLFENQKFVGARPLYGGSVGIDATWKEGYPKPLEPEPSTVRLVDRRWDEYWK